MGSSSLRQLLMSLCCDFPWDYAVFWRLQHQKDMLLSWEDGYFNCPESGESTGCMADDIYLKNSDGISLTGGLDVCSRSVGGYPLKLAVAEMSSTYHVLGKGVVGEVASSGHPRWIFFDDVAAGGFTSNSETECPDEWIFQFLAGIETILLIPFVPLGVLQLGSVQMVAKDLKLVDYVKEKFYAHSDNIGYCLPVRFPEELLTQPVTLFSSIMENLNDLSVVSLNKVCTDHRDDDSVCTADYKLSTYMAEGTENISDDKIIMQPVSMVDVHGSLDYQFCEVNKSEMTSCNSFRSCIEVEAERLSCHNNQNPLCFEEHGHDFLDISFRRGLSEPQYSSEELNCVACGCSRNALSFPKHSELHEALGPTFFGATGHHLQDYGSEEIVTNGPIHKGDLHHLESSTWYFSGSFVNEDYTNKILDDSLVNHHSISEDNSSGSNSSGSLKSSSSKVVVSSNGENKSEQGGSVENKTVSESCLTFAPPAKEKKALTDFSDSVSSFDILSALIEKQEQRNEYGTMHHNKKSNVSSSHKKRGRPGDNQKARPRDRQLIQDRIKELRELIPNSAKCSIDGLLDRTIKHMLFLRDVADQADKLRKQVQEAPSNQITPGSPEAKARYQQGTSWALEVGGDEQSCPIIVKDLKHPGHMLIEMMCNDHGHFLEIADVIHRLELTILKGVMEKRTQGTWAKFIVEASGTFHRLDIFWPLMQLLQQNRTPISSKM